MNSINVSLEVKIAALLNLIQAKGTCQFKEKDFLIYFRRGAMCYFVILIGMM